jgi:hypothetical protein
VTRGGEGGGVTRGDEGGGGVVWCVCVGGGKRKQGHCMERAGGHAHMFQLYINPVCVCGGGGGPVKGGGGGVISQGRHAPIIPCCPLPTGQRWSTE